MQNKTIQSARNKVNPIASTSFLLLLPPPPPPSSYSFSPFFHFFCTHSHLNQRNKRKSFYCYFCPVFLPMLQINCSFEFARCILFAHSLPDCRLAFVVLSNFPAPVSLSLSFVLFHCKHFIQKLICVYNKCVLVPMFVHIWYGFALLCFVLCALSVYLYTHTHITLHKASVYTFYVWLNPCALTIAVRGNVHSKNGVYMLFKSNKT